MIKKFFKIIMSFSLIMIICIISGCESKPADSAARPSAAARPVPAVRPAERAEADKPATDPVDDAVAAEEVDDGLIERIAVEAETGNMEKALQIFEEGRSGDQLLHVILLIQNRRLDEAESILAQVIKGDPSNITALYYSSLIYNLKGDTNNERRVLERIIRSDADHIDANISLGRIYAGERSHSRAEAAFRRVISAHGYVEDAVLGYGMALLAQEKTAEALAQFNTVIRNSPDNVFAYIYRARIKSFDNDFAGAERDLSEAIKLDPDFIWSYLDRGRARLYAGRYNSAIEDFTKVISKDDTIFIAYIHRAWANEGIEQNDLALADYRRALELRGDYQRGFIPFALQLYRAEQWNEAAIYFIRAYDVSRNPEFLLFAAASLKHAGENRLADRLIRDNMNRIPREDLLFHIARLFVDPAYEAIVLNRFRQEQDPFVIMKGNFYLALYYDTFGRNILSEQHFGEVLDSGLIQSMEYKVARWKIR